MSLEQRKEKEGDAEMALAAKSLKTGMFSRWKPDWEEAAGHFEKAATSYRVAKAFAMSMVAYAKAAEAHENSDSDFMAAKHLETAATIARDSTKDTAQAATYLEQASRVHLGAGRADAAADALNKAARAVEQHDPKRGAALAVSACELFDLADEPSRLMNAVEIYKGAVSLLLRTAEGDARGAQLVQAATLLEKQAPLRELLIPTVTTKHSAALHAALDSAHSVARCELSAVVVRLAAGDYEAALLSHERASSSGGGYAASEESYVGSALLDAYASQSAEGLVACIGNPNFAFLENQVTRLAKGLTLQSARVPASRLTAGGASAASSAPPSMALAPPSSAAEPTGDFGEVAPEDEKQVQLSADEDPDDLC